jgi:hypothetical protein
MVFDERFMLTAISNSEMGEGDEFECEVCQS